MTDAQNNATGGTTRGGHAAAYMAALLGVVFIVLFVLPGFLAAGFSRASSGIVSLNDSELVFLNEGSLPVPFIARAEQMMLLPSMWLMTQSYAIRRFYMWEYRSGGGRDAYTP